MSIHQVIPITPVKASLSDAVRMAVGEIEQFLSIHFPADIVASSKAAKGVAGLWLSRVKGFHADDDFLHLTRDMLQYVQSGGARSRVSDQLAYFFSGFMPSYGSACILLDMVGTGQTWREVQAFMHSQSYGNARAYVEGFDWAGGQKRAQAETKAWVDVLVDQTKWLDALAAQSRPMLLASAQPVYAPPVTPSLPPAANEPYMPKPAPSLRVVPPIEPVPVAPAAGAAAEAWGWRLLALLGDVAIIILLPLTLSGDTPRPQPKSETLTVPLDKTETSAASNTTNNECAPQTEQNKANGAECENDGYVLMEKALQYKRLVDPPKGRGLDGLFEKLMPMNGPNPLPELVTVPKPGKIIFLPAVNKPPQARYDFVGKPPVSTYPKFVVFEAKHVSKSFDEKDHDGITKETKNRLSNTCDGQQLGTKWTENRIPQALERQSPGAKNRVARTQTRNEILVAGYARWIFVCLPGPVGSKTKLYVLIDVVASGMDLDSKAPKLRKQPSNTDTGY